MATEIWYIAKAKLKFKGIEDIPKIDKNEWHLLVDADEELFWNEDLPYWESSLKLSGDYGKKNRAVMDINKKGWGNVQFNFDEQVGDIFIVHTRKTLKRIEKYYDIAQKLNANLYRYKTLIDEKKLDEIREQYRIKKEGRRAPKEKK